jgi:phosphohistidine phosphatase SixA
MRYVFLSLILVVISATQLTYAQEAIFLIRHAEQVHDVEDPPLTEAGHKRAEAWAGILEKAGIKAVYTSEKKRTKQTGEIIAQALNVPLESVPRKEVTLLVNKIHAQNADDRVLIVTHKLQMTKIFRELGLWPEVAEKVTFSREEYGNLFIFVPNWGSDGKVLQLRY